MKKQRSTVANLALALEFARKGKNRKAAKHLLAAASTPDAAWPFPSNSLDARFRRVQAQLQRIRAAVAEAEEDLTHLHRAIRLRDADALDDYGLDDEDESADELADDLDLSDFDVLDEYAMDDAGHGLVFADAENMLGGAGEEDGAELAVIKASENASIQHAR